MWHLILGVVTLFAIDGAIFHSGFYTKLLKRDSYAGNIALLVAQECARTRSPATQEIAVLGDSRMFEAFSEQSADARTADSNLRFLNLAAFRCSLRVWYYVLRDLDPQANRYRAIVIPIRYADDDHGRALVDGVADIKHTAPFLRCTDALDLARSYSKWPDKCHAFIACFLRGYAFRDDLHDLLINSTERFQLQKADGNFLTSRYEYAGNPRSLAGVTIDPVTQEVFVPQHLAALKASLQSSIKPPQNRGWYKQYRAEWLGRIRDHYARSQTAIVFLQMPRGPLGGPTSSLTRESSIAELKRGDHTFALHPRLFESVERPEFFADRHHLNASGREMFTQILTDELAKRFPAPKDESAMR